MAAVLAGGDGTVLSHRSAAALWGLMRATTPIEITAPRGRRRPSIVVHESGVAPAERTARARIPVTTVARTLFDLAEVVDERRHERAWEEADRLGLLKIAAVEDVCERGHGRHALPAIRRLIEAARLPETVRSPLEERFLEFCREHELPPPQTNVLILGKEVDAYWPDAALVVESDGWTFHGHRAAFERDRSRDAAMQAQGYRVLRVTDRRLKHEPNELAVELRALLALPKGRAGG
jgi:very-short-patch-repair endonuclease